MIKKFLPYLLAVLVFFVVLAAIRPPARTPVVVAVADLPAGHILAEGDVALKPVPADILPTEGVLTDPGQAVGQALRVDRAAGDVILAQHLGEKPVLLQPNERAVALKVTDSSGLAGIVRPGDLVGVSAVIFRQGADESGAYSKATIEGLRVLYIQPSFQAEDPSEATGQIVTPDPVTGIALQRQRKSEGAVIVAVPVDARAVTYDFPAAGIEATPAVRLVNAVELLTALDASDNARLYLYLMPDNPQPMQSAGLWLPDLIIRQVTPTPTPTVLP